MLQEYQMSFARPDGEQGLTLFFAADDDAAAAVQASSELAAHSAFTAVEVRHQSRLVVRFERPQGAAIPQARNGMDIRSSEADNGGSGPKAAAFPDKMTLHDANYLIESLPPEDRAALLEIARPFEFPIGHVFCDHGDTISHVDFLDRGVISAVFTMKDGRGVEAYMVGREGVTHPMALEGASLSAARLVGQIAGSGRRVEVARLALLAEERPAIRDALMAYAARLLGELEQSTACNALHRAEQRFSKWLLRCHDRTDGDRLNLTQEFLANMLGAQRTTVNEAAQHLQKGGAIRYMRGSIQIKDRSVLERASCECYAAHYDTLRQGRRAIGIDPEE